MGIDIAKNAKRIVIIGGGFGGVKLAQQLSKESVDVLLIDKNNYHQFQPLFYQVATSGLEPSSIIFPFRKLFQRKRNVQFRMGEVNRIDTENNELETSLGKIAYDQCIIATGAGNNFFGNENIEKHALPMKSISESLELRNVILERFEQALSVGDDEQQSYMTIVIAGGGPTGVELAGTLGEMKRYILPKDYPELDFSKMKILLVEGSERVLNAMDAASSVKAHKYLTDLGVEIKVETRVNDYDGKVVHLSDAEIPSKTLIWAAGIRANTIDGIPSEVIQRGNRIQVDEYNQVKGIKDVFAIGDVAVMNGDPEFKDGHPQLAQVAIQQGKRLAENLALNDASDWKPFRYKNLGTMATVGRNKAVVELPNYKFQGFFAWMVWMLVHLRSILGVKNKWVVFMNWIWNYFTYNLSLRLIIRRGERKI